MNVAGLTQDENLIDQFCELGNIGAGQAASCLSDMINRTCLIDVPKVAALDPANLRISLNKKDTVAVGLRIKIFGDVPSLMYVITHKADAKKIVSYMAHDTSLSQEDDFSFASQFALKQVGEAITRAFSNAIFEFISSEANYAMPEIIIDEWSAAVDKMLAPLEAALGQYLVVQSGFFDPEKSFEGKFIYIMTPEAQRTAMMRFQELMGISSH